MALVDSARMVCDECMKLVTDVVTIVDHCREATFGCPGRPGGGSSDVMDCWDCWRDDRWRPRAGGAWRLLADWSAVGLFAAQLSPVARDELDCTFLSVGLAARP